MNEFTDKLFLLGSPGCGKTFYINEQQQIFIFDLYNEHQHLIKNINGKDIVLSPYSDNIINPFDAYIDFDYGLNRKYNFIISMMEVIMNKDFSPILKSKLLPIIILLYKPYIEYLQKSNINIDRQNSPTFIDFYNLLMKTNDEDLIDMARAIEIFCHGSINTFSSHTNIDTSFGAIRYDLYQMGSNLISLTMMICIEDIFIRMKENYNKHISSYMFIEDSRILFIDKFITKYFTEICKSTRMLGGHIILAAHSFADIILNQYSFDIICNFSKFIIFHQGTCDFEYLEKYLELSAKQLDLIKHFSVGEYLEL